MVKMKQQDKELLLKDLCGRQMYNVKCQVFNDANPYTLSGVLHNKPYSQLYFEELDWKEHDGFVGVEYCKPYLFPLSSMTEEQEEEFKTLYYRYYESAFIFNERFAYDRYRIKVIGFYPCYLQDWLNQNHFDYRGLIKKGLALDATNKDIYEK